MAFRHASATVPSNLRNASVLLLCKESAPPRIRHASETSLNCYFSASTEWDRSATLPGVVNIFPSLFTTRTNSDTITLACRLISFLSLCIFKSDTQVCVHPIQSHFLSCSNNGKGKSPAGLTSPGYRGCVRPWTALAIKHRRLCPSRTTPWTIYALA